MISPDIGSARTVSTMKLPLSPLMMCAFLAAVGLYIANEFSMQPPVGAEVRFLRNGSVNAALLRTNGGTVLINGGSDSDFLEMLAHSLPVFHRRIDLLILTSPDKEHIGSLSEIVRRYDVRHVLLCDTPSADPLFRRFLRDLKEQNIPLSFPADAPRITIGDSTIEPIETAAPHRMLVKIHHSGTTLMIAGLLRPTQAKELLEDGHDLSADIVSIDHLSPSADFIKAVRPRLGILPTPITAHSLPAKPFQEQGIDLQSTAPTEELLLRF